MLQSPMRRVLSRLYSCSQKRLNAADNNNNSGTALKKPILTLFTKEVCPLCDEAKHELRDLLPLVQLETVNIEEDPELYKKYRYDIPVFHLNGEFLFKHRANKEKLEDELRKLSSMTPR